MTNDGLIAKEGRAGRNTLNSRKALHVLTSVGARIPGALLNDSYATTARIIDASTTLDILFHNFRPLDSHKVDFLEI